MHCDGTEILKEIERSTWSFLLTCDFLLSTLPVAEVGPPCCLPVVPSVAWARLLPVWDRGILVVVHLWDPCRRRAAHLPQSSPSQAWARVLPWVLSRPLDPAHPCHAALVVLGGTTDTAKHAQSSITGTLDKDGLNKISFKQVVC